MALDVYTKEDICNAIAANLIAMITTCVAHGITNAEHARGFIDGQHALATAMAIDWDFVTSHVAESCQLDSLDATELLPNQNRCATRT